MNLWCSSNIVTIFVAIIIMSGCEKEHRPNANTLEHKLAHGYVDGTVNKLRVGNTLLKIPPDVYYNPVTSGKITPGKADQVYFWLRYPQFESSGILNRVLIMVRKGYEDPRKWNKSLKNRKWRKIIKREDLNLIEYHLDSDSKARGYLVYVPMDPEFTTPKGSLIRYTCAGNKEGITYCLSGFVLGRDLYVEYKVTKSLLPYWREIHLDVVDYISVIGHPSSYSCSDVEGLKNDLFNSVVEAREQFGATVSMGR